MATTSVRLSFDGLPAAFRRAIESAAQDAGIVTEDGTPVTLLSFDHTSDRCARLDEHVADSIAIALIQPFDEPGIGHVAAHGGYAADLDAEPEEVLACVLAACDGRVRVPLDLVVEFTAGDPHRPVQVSPEEADWLRALAAGATVVKVADDFGYSERVLFRRLHDLYTRLGASNRSEAIVSAQRVGILRRNGGG